MTAAIGVKSNFSITDEHTDAAPLRIIVLGDQALPATEAEGANPAFKRQLVQRTITGQAVLNVHIGSRVNCLGSWFVVRESCQNWIVLSNFRFWPKLDNTQLIGNRTADTQVNLFSGRNALFSISMQAGQHYFSMRWNRVPIARGLLAARFRRNSRCLEIGDNVSDFLRAEYLVESIRHHRNA